MDVENCKQVGETGESKAMAALESKKEMRMERNSLSWKRGPMLGRGSFGTVNMALFCNQENHHLLTTAVKSSLDSKSSALRREAIILSKLRGSPHIVRFLGDDFTTEDSQTMYNVFLEYIAGGTLAEKIKTAPSGLHQSHVRNYTRSILTGLSYIHSRGYVHCDIKPQNLLLCSASQVKIADFGWAKKVGERAEFGLRGLRGTPLYLAPESVRQAEFEPAVDIWALGCVVLEMLTGKAAWECAVDDKVDALIFLIGYGQILPKIPGWLSEEGKDFLTSCLVRDPRKRWTADMLLQHRFIRR